MAFMAMLNNQRVIIPNVIELDDGKIYTGKPDQFDGNLTHGFPV